MIDFRIGCSGYHYAEWKGIFYPFDLQKAKWFEFYCTHFNTIELNLTFYKFPRVEFLQKWYNRSPDNFTFSVKAPRVITHFKKMNDAQRYLADFYNAVSRGLKEKAGCVLFQFPSSFEFSEERLDLVTTILDKTFNNVVEFRHASWWNQTVYNSFQSNNTVFSGMSHPALPDATVITNNIVYYRFHGVPHLYKSSYRPEELEAVLTDITDMAHVKQAYIIFNNTMEAGALNNGKEFQKIVELVH